MYKLTDFSPVKESPYQEMSFGDLGDELGRLQRAAQALQIPVLIMIDGWESSGKGYTLAKLIQELEPRHYRVHVFDDRTSDEEDYPFLWRYWEATPTKEQIVIFDRSSYFDLLTDPEIDQGRYQVMLDDIVSFERQLADSGCLVLKFFLNVSEETQKAHITEYMSEDYSEFLVSPRDEDQNENYDKYRKYFERVLTDSSEAALPWHIINMEKRKAGAKDLISIVIEAMRQVIDAAKVTGKPDAGRRYEDAEQPLAHVVQPERMKRKAYRKRLKELQEESRSLSYRLYTENLPVVMAFEGIDAAGKGGTIKRLVKGMDPRGYNVHSIEAPSSEELAHHYLWRFYHRMPRRGTAAIFDRSWYGRVLVERVDRLTEVRDWERSYREINEMERHMVNSDVLVLKYFLTIGPDEQKARFEAREEDPDKQHKITEDDWHNRSQWDDYMEAFNEMLVRTSTAEAPWVIVPSEDKRSARIQVLEDYIRRVKEHLKDNGVDL